MEGWEGQENSREVGDPARTGIWTKKGLLGRAEAKGKGGCGLEVVIKFGQAGVTVEGWILKAVGTLDLGWCLSESRRDCVPRASESSHLGA